MCRPSSHGGRDGVMLEEGASLQVFAGTTLSIDTKLWIPLMSTAKMWSRTFMTE